MPSASMINGMIPTNQRVSNAIASASQRTGVDFNYLLSQARIESALNPSARAATSSATGLFQFTKQTWLGTVKEHGAQHGLGWAADAITKNSKGVYSVSDAQLRASILNLREDPEAASSMAAEFASDNGDYLQTQLGRSPEPVDLYLAHFLGAGGAVQFLSAFDRDPSTAAAPLLPEAAAANLPIFFDSNGNPRSVGEIRERFAAKLGGSNAGNFQWASNSGSNGWEARQSWASQAAAGNTFTNAPQMRGFEPMPKKLDLAFAHQAYQRLASLGGGSAS